MSKFQGNDQKQDYSITTQQPLQKSSTGKPIYLLLAYLILLAVVFFLPDYSAPGYSIIHNTTSELGAQQTPNAWIMNLTFILLGLGSLISGWAALGKLWFHRIALIVFSLSLILVGIFHHMPIDPELTYSVREDDLHSIFASLTGFSFIALAFSTGLVLSKPGARWWAFSIAMMAGLLSALIFYKPEYMGIWQRILFIISFGWMVVAYWKRIA
ncbi:MAG: DUF998 domain-containing protein [Lewinellaceae bacterium]|nr:DUF998 domain-containing protein [Lewinellaceae bacterium]